MKIEKIKTQGLSHLSYFLSSGDSAVVVDPRRDIDIYLKKAQEQGRAIRYILETHRQEDFVLGSRALKEATGAQIVAGAHEYFAHCDIRLREKEILECGDFRFELLNTPGHTPESVSYGVYLNEQKECWGVFTGDALFIGETGRTDLSAKEKTEENGKVLYRSIHNKIKPLGPQTLLFPAHGSGSVCGGSIAQHDSSTLGYEFGTNPVFNMNEEEFARHKTNERIPRPPYFDLMEKVNLKGGLVLERRSLDIPALSPQELKERAAGGKLVIDTRLPEAFAGGHIESSLSIWLEGLAVFGGWTVVEKEPVYLVMERDSDIHCAFAFLARLGVGNIKGYLAGGFESWRDAGLSFERSEMMAASELKQNLDDYLVYDVREINEYEQGHIPGARHCYVGDLEDCLERENIPLDANIVVTCSVGHRGSLGASIFLKRGYKNVKNLAGGMKAYNG